MPRKRTGTIEKRGENSHRIRYYNAVGQRQQETIIGTYEDAERELARRQADLANGIPVSAKLNTITFAELAHNVLTDYEVNGFVSVDDQERRIRLHLNPVFGDRKACAITSNQIREYILARKREGSSDGNINRELELMRHCFKLAIEERNLLYAPHVPMLSEDNVRQGFVIREEVDRICAYLPFVLARFVLFAFLTGWRYGEIVKLLWQNVDLDHHREIRIGTSKNREGRVFPLTGELYQLFCELREDRQKATLVSPHVFAINGKKIGAFRKQWNTACFKAGLPCKTRPIQFRGKAQFDRDGKPKVKVLKSERTFHDLRRSFAREMDKEGVRQSAIMKLAGWKTDSVFRRYNIVSEADLRDAIETVDRKAVRKITDGGSNRPK